MKEKIKKSIKGISTILASVVVLALPLVVAAGNAGGTGGISNIKGQLDKFITPTGLSGNADLVTIIGAIVATILAVLGVLLVVLIIYAGFLWMTSQGDATKTKKSKDMIFQAIIGLLIIFAAYAITNFVIGALQTTVTTGAGYTGGNP